MATSYEYITAYLCLTKEIGLAGNLFGGTMLAWMDEAAGIYVFRYTEGQHAVTLKYSEIVFEYPVREGDMVDFYAGNPRVGRTSITFDVQGRVGENVVFTTQATFVTVSPEGRPTPIRWTGPRA